MAIKTDRFTFRSNPFAFAPEQKFCLLPSPDSATAKLSLRQKIMSVSIAVLSSFAIGSIPVVYAFTAAPTPSPTTRQTPILRSEMF